MSIGQFALYVIDFLAGLAALWALYCFFVGAVIAPWVAAKTGKEQHGLALIINGVVYATIAFAWWYARAHEAITP